MLPDAPSEYTCNVWYLFLLFSTKVWFNLTLVNMSKIIFSFDRNCYIFISKISSLRAGNFASLCGIDVSGQSGFDFLLCIQWEFDFYFLSDCFCLPCGADFVWLPPIWFLNELIWSWLFENSLSLCNNVLRFWCLY